MKRAATVVVVLALLGISMNFVAAPKAFGVSPLPLVPREAGAGLRRLPRFRDSTREMFVQGVLSASHGAELSAEELKAARKIYVGKCAKCHKLYDPSDYTPEKWSEWMGKMTKKSKLKPAQVELLARYIEAGKSGRVELPKPRRAEADGPAD